MTQLRLLPEVQSGRKLGRHVNAVGRFALPGVMTLLFDASSAALRAEQNEAPRRAIARLLDEAWRDPPSSMDVTFTRRMGRPPKSAEAIRTAVEQVYAATRSASTLDRFKLFAAAKKRVLLSEIVCDAGACSRKRDVVSYDPAKGTRLQSWHAADFDGQGFPIHWKEEKKLPDGIVTTDELEFQAVVINPESDDSVFRFQPQEDYSKVVYGGAATTVTEVDGRSRVIANAEAPQESGPRQWLIRANGAFLRTVAIAAIIRRWRSRSRNCGGG